MFTSRVDAALLANRLERLNRGLDDLAGVGLAFDEAAASALHPPPVEQAVDELLQAQALFAERVDAAVLELGVARRRRSVSVNMRIDVSGVRSSCDTFETKSLCSWDRLASRRTNTQTSTLPVTTAPVKHRTRIPSTG